MSECIKLEQNHGMDDKEKKNDVKEVVIDPSMAGRAKIKPEFLIDAPEKKSIVHVQANDDKTENIDAPPPKKKKRGQNKNRPQTQRDKLEDCLCPSLVSDKGKCTFGDKCRFIHDTAKYMSMKPEDIGEECYAFKTHGKCHYGISCRYGSCHIKKMEDGSYQSIQNETTLTSNPAPKIINFQPRDFLLSLRKKKYEFTKSDKILKELFPNGKNTQNGVTDSKVPDTEVMKNTEDLHSQNGTNFSKINTGPLLDDTVGEKKTVPFKGKLFLAPLTTVGNLPYRVTCKSLGADITCGEMAVATSLLQGNISEWALLKRHPCEDIFGVQICGAFPDSMTKCAELIEKKCDVDFVDINMGCPIDIIYHKGAGSALMRRTNKLFDIVKSVNKVLTIPLTCKMRTGIDTKHNTAHTILPKLRDFGVALSTVHGRSRQARYTKLADWDYIDQCAKAAAPMPLFGNGDILSFEDYNHVEKQENVDGVMIARGALIKPWIFTEIKEQKHWDISSSERFDILKKFVNTGLMHWGSDSRGVETTRKFLLEWLSFLHRYIPVGVLERVPQKINEQPPLYIGRNDLETLMASQNCQSWVEISEMLLGKVPEGFHFLPKHKANSYS
ncbi:tRNA-dihydrouridine(47) synthase [NAD(P)(+)]-like [Styela clava]|uniref:tRNA-dihydrouridine(47) synthase [NAD(P)(+)]-like n=1 Tax=Styela clava TaxID=7725 RepID=UPI001939CFE0|nr:tRNA-dihydrouridine(47) synthase [NAD(P)(+)]-like [Styela clava]